MRDSITSPAAVVLLSLWLGGCAVGPDARAPAAAPVEQFAARPADASTRADEAQFWAGFGDPVLAGLSARALQHNHDLRAAVARLEQADAVLRQRRLDQLPTITAGAGAAHQRYSADQQPGVAADDRRVESFDVGLELGWELDLWGRVRRAVEAGRADADAAAADLDALRIATAAQLATSYFELRGLQARLDVARNNAANQQQTQELVQQRVSYGLSTDFDLARVRAQLEATRATIPALEQAVAIQRHRIAVLAGLTPDAPIDGLDSPAPIASLQPAIDPGTPGELLRRRPDVAAAELRLAAATARIGVSQADMFPRFTLAGLIGSQAADVDDLFGHASETRLIALGVDWSFLDSGRVRARIRAAGAAESEALARYEQTVLQAIADTENALIRASHSEREAQHLAAAASAGTQASELARLRYEAGAADLLEVLDAERTRLAAEDAWADARSRQAVAVVDLYRALSGGWTPPPAEVAAR